MNHSYINNPNNLEDIHESNEQMYKSESDSNYENSDFSIEE